MKFLLILIAILFLGNSKVYSQVANQERIDSLLAELPKYGEDTNRVRLLSELSFEYKTKDIKKGIEYGKNALNLAKKIDWKEGEAISYESISLNYDFNKESKLALENLENAYKIYEKLNNIPKIAIVASNLSSFYSTQRNIREGYKFNQIAIDLIEKIENKYQLAELYKLIASFYFNELEHETALEYYNKSKNLYKELKNEFEIKILSGYLATIYLDWGELETAKELYEESIEYFTKIGNKYQLSNDLLDISKVFIISNDSSKALEYLNKAEKIKNELNDDFGTATILALKGAINFKRKKFDKSEIYFDSAIVKFSLIPDSLEVKKNYQNLGLLHFYKNEKENAILNCFNSLRFLPNEQDINIDTYSILYRIYKYYGNFDTALVWYEKYNKVRDSINNDFSQKDIDLINVKHEFEVSKQKSEEEKRETRNILIYIACISAFLLIFLIIIYRKNQTKKKLNAQLEDKNTELSALNELIQKESAEKIKMQEQLYQKDLQEKNKEFKNLSIEILDKTNAINELRIRLKKECDANPEMQAVIMKSLEKTLKLDENTQKFDEYLDLIYKDFHTNLKQKYPDISSAELKVCTYIKMNYDTKEIADLLARSPRTVEKHKENIRKKMNLGSDDNLQDFILGLN
jgi:tetratricopeptide (TPR) repeat protein